MQIFFATLKDNEAHNSRADVSYSRAISKHSDLSTEERKKFRLGLKHVMKRSLHVIPLNISMNNEVPDAGEIFFYLIKYF